MSRFAKIAVYGLYGLGISHVIGEHIGCFVSCHGNSMVPTLQDGDMLWAARCRFSEESPFDKLAEGDIVCLTNPTDSSMTVVKRINKFRRHTCSSFVPIEVEVRGDNAAVSIDSRDYGPVPVGLIKYKAICIIFPWERRRWLMPYKPNNSS